MTPDMKKCPNDWERGGKKAQEVDKRTQTLELEPGGGTRHSASSGG